MPNLCDNIRNKPLAVYNIKHFSSVSIKELCKEYYISSDDSISYEGESFLTYLKLTIDELPTDFTLKQVISIVESWHSVSRANFVLYYYFNKRCRCFSWSLERLCVKISSTSRMRYSRRRSYSISKIISYLYWKAYLSWAIRSLVTRQI